MMKLATWNVNSIRARAERVLDWLARTQPDVVCLQEIKVTDDAFDREPLERAGYHAAVFGQKTYNGVAILSRAEPEDIRRGIQDDVDDPQARLISAKIEGVRVISAYVPNGRTVGSEAYDYKLQWLARLRAHLERIAEPGDEVVVAGDFNVAPADTDVARPDEWADSVLCDAAARDALEQVRLWGLVDVFRQHHPEGGLYSWWDYRMLAFPKNNGLRIDHILAAEPLAGRCSSVEIDRDERKTKGELKPSDHAPVIATFE